MKAITPLILLGIAIASYFVYMKPAYDTIQTLTAKKDQYTNVVEKAKELAVRRDTILSEYNAISPADIDRLKKVIPETFDSVILARYISTIASSHGMIIKSTKITEPQAETREVAIAPQDGQYKKMQVTFSVKGPYDQFVKFVKDLESGLYLMDVSSISIRGDVKSTPTSALDYDVELLTYSFN